MKLRKLAILCIHDQMTAHWQRNSDGTVELCPGGVFLPDDTLVIEKVGEKCETCGGVGTTYATYVDSDGALIVAVGKAPSQCGTCRGTGMVSYLDELLDRIGQAATFAVPRLLPHEADEIAITILDTLFVREAE